MKLHFSGTDNTRYMGNLYQNYNNSDINLLVAFPYKRSLMGNDPKSFKHFIADSGAFTAMNTGKKIDSKFIDQYIEWIVENGIQHYIEMDLDEIIGVQKTAEIRKYIEDSVGIKSIQTWHKERGLNGWIEMCESCDYIAISMSRKTNVSRWIYEQKFKPLETLMHYAYKNKTKVHALGCTNFNVLKRFHFYSCDSSSFTSGSRYGTIYNWEGDHLQQYSSKNKRLDYGKIQLQNVKAFKEAMDYAEKYL